jgi:hypothetical protein
MQTVTILRELWRLRLLVFLIGLLAMAAAISVAYKVSPSKLESRKYSVGIASARLLVDTPESQVVEVAPEGSDGTGVRANLLANLMVEGEIKAVIAKRAGLRPDQLEGVSKTTAAPAAGAEPPDPRGYVLTTDVLSSADGDRLPIIEIEAQAPDAEKAATLADAAITGLRGHLDSKAAVEQVADADRLRLNSLGAPQARNVVRGPHPVMAIAAGLFIFVAGCAAILGFFGLVRAWRAAENEAHGDDEEYDAAALNGSYDHLPQADHRPTQNGSGAARRPVPTPRNGSAPVQRADWSFPRPAPPPPPPAPDEVDVETRAESA